MAKEACDMANEACDMAKGLGFRLANGLLACEWANGIPDACFGRLRPVGSADMGRRRFSFQRPRRDVVVAARSSAISSCNVILHHQVAASSCTAAASAHTAKDCRQRPGQTAAGRHQTAAGESKKAGDLKAQERLLPILLGFVAVARA